MIKRYVASKDATITNAYKYNNDAVRATGSNVGGADSGQVFSLFGNISTGSISSSSLLFFKQFVLISWDFWLIEWFFGIYYSSFFLSSIAISSSIACLSIFGEFTNNRFALDLEN